MRQPERVRGVFRWVAAAEVAVGLAIIVVVYRRRQSASVDDLTVLRG
jgi:NADH:ubiquinone oxidoreductase subunit K